MLNELYDAAHSLETAGISPKKWHKEFVSVRKPSKQKPAFYIFIDQLADITSIECVDDPKSIADLRTWESKGDLRQSFPYFNIPPLLWIRFDPRKDDADKTMDNVLKGKRATAEQLRQFIVGAENATTTKKWDSNAYAKLQSCLDKGAALKPILGTTSPAYESIVALIDRLSSSSAQAFQGKLYAAFVRQMLEHPGDAAKYWPGLFYAGEREPGNIITILLELSDATSNFEYPVRHERIREWINQRLITATSASNDNPSASDIFGNSSSGATQKFDEVRMRNALGNVKLRAMAEDAGCQFRYGKAGPESCPVGQVSRSKMKGALEWLTEPAREGKTWVSVLRAADNKEILLAYPSMLPPDPPDTATFFGGPPVNDSSNSARFEEYAQNVSGTLRGLMAKNPNLDIRVFVLRKMDTARTRVSSHRRYNAERLISCAKVWQEGCRNVPRVLVKQFNAKGRSGWQEPLIPFPMEVVWVLNTLWLRGGKGGAQRNDQSQWAPVKVKGITPDDGISLLLDEDTLLRPVLRHALYAATRNSLGLVMALGQAHAQGQVFSAAKGYARQSLILPPVLGLLLYRLSVPKEEYMKSAPYLIGRLLSLADQLHYHYCQHARDGKAPPQLMGNALMPTALEEPVKALALYSNRILPYQAWAKTASGDAARLAHYLLAELGRVCSEASLTAVPERCSDSDKAQMLIGYLARPEKSDSDITQ